MLRTRFSTRSVRLVAAVVLLLATAGATRAIADPAIYEIGRDPDVGFNLISWGNFGGGGVSTWETAVQSLHDYGYRDVSICPVRFVDITTGHILATSPKGPELSHIDAAVARAKQFGMHVTLNPFVELYDPTETSDQQYFADITWGTGPANNQRNTWRGAYNPANYPNAATQVPTFWSEYKSYMVDVAQIAQNRGADAMNIGTEYNALNADANYNDDWGDVIGAVDGVFTGKLGYAANWDMYANGNVSSAIWNDPRIDYLGVDAYFTNEATATQANASGAFGNPTFTSLMQNYWNGRLNSIYNYAAGRKGGAGMPVVLTEVGYLPYNQTTVNPQHQGSVAEIDTAEQRMAFNGLISASDGEKEQLRSMYVWQWPMPGSDGSAWNMDRSLPANQFPYNTDAAQWLFSYVNSDVAGFAADFNVDGFVNDADFAQWAARFGDNPTTSGDADHDGDADGEDFLAWQQLFGAGVGQTTASASVPEPTAAALVGMACAAAILHSRRRRMC